MEHLDLELFDDDHQQEEAQGEATVADVAAVDDGGEEEEDLQAPADFPALQLGDYPAASGGGVEEIKAQWLRYNHQLEPRKDVIAMVSDARKGLWKSICGCVKGVKTIKDWKAQEICKAHIFVSGDTVKSIRLQHTCTDQHAGRTRNYNARDLHQASQDLLNVVSIPPHKKRQREVAIMEYMETAEREGFSVGRGQAYKVVSRLSKQPIEAQIGEFYFLQSLFQAWKRADPDGSYTLEKAPCAWMKRTSMEQFQRYYIAPSISKHAWKHSRIHLFISDASETSSNWSSFQMSLLMAVTLDGNNNVVILALAMCDSDSELNWIWFLQNLMRDFGKIHVFLSSSPHVFGDFIPNLLELMNAAPSRCVESLVQALEKSLSLELIADEKEQILQLARSTSAQAYDHSLRGLARNNPDVAAYLDARKHLFVAYSVLQSSTSTTTRQPSPVTKRQRFGQVVSRANDLVQSQVQETLDQPVTTMTISLLMKMSELHLERKLQAQKWLEQGQLLSAYARELYSQVLQDADSCQVQLLGQDGNLWRAVVSGPSEQQQQQQQHADDTSRSFVVTANTGSFQIDCSCQHTEEMGLPCVHATALLKRQALILENAATDATTIQWFHPRYHTSTLLQMYDCDPPDFSVFGKVAVQELIPPEHLPNLGAAKKRRKTTAASTSNNNTTTFDNAAATTGTPHKCAACGELGHHPKTCHHPSTKYRYQQFADKAMEWAKAALDLQL